MKRIVVVVVCAGLAGCQALPGAGPLAADINAQSGRSIAESHRPNAAVFEVVDVDARTARTVANFSVGLLKRRFGIGGGAKSAVIGVGDQLRVTIFEAGSDGLFSTSDSKQTNIDIVVQPDGKAAIPYVGQVVFAGRTLEQARQAVLSALVNKAVEPDVIVTSASTASRNVTVSGAVGKPSMVPLGLSGETIMEVIAKAGGPAAQPYESYVTLTRGNKTGTALLQSIVDNPSENIYVQPKDQIFVTQDPRTFTALGEVWKNGRIPFGANDVNLLEAIALAGGGSDERIDAKGYFVFRYEEPEIVSDLLGPERFHDLLSKGMAPNKEGKYPIVYRFDMSVADSLIIGQNFPIKSRDVIYASRHPAVDFQKFMRLVSGPVTTARTAQLMMNQ
ncbi:polysaccharide biosynthesis/export family protein [Ciceribacter thiooxidans]|uniref:Polysaccharide biosynthesis/export family protein n=1 Tax=Ciceribacter thiooxidans TaxID=1969821 RepID=A0ABV7IBJ7_9HYPH|nr:polysaccharide biosynthesis/export family protein [Ciceribacter thiooxidans]